MVKCVITCVPYEIASGTGKLEAGVESSVSPVGLGVDSSIRMLARGCRWGSPGGVTPSPTPLSGRGVAH